MSEPDDRNDETDRRRLLEHGWQKPVVPPTDDGRPTGPPRATAAAAERPEQPASSDGPKEDRNDG